MSNARKLADNLPSEGQLGNRRLNINGDMKIAQRAISAATSDGTEGYKTLDRWYILYSSGAGGAATMSQDTTVPNTSFANSLKLDVTTADTSIDANHAITLQYRFEAQDIANSGWDYTNSNSNMSVSFWARSVKAGTYCVFFLTDDGTQKSLVQEYTLEADTWKYVTLRFKGDSGISFNNDNGLGLYVGWTLVAGSNRYQSATAGTWIERSSGNNQARYATSNQVNFFDSTSNDFYLTGVQIEVGSQSTPFEHEPVGVTMNKCQRYYQRQLPMNGTGVVHSSGTMVARLKCPLPVTMRVSPTVSIIGTPPAYDGSAVYNVTGINSQWTTPNLAELDINISGSLTTGRAVMFYNEQSINQGLQSAHGIALDAEL